MDFAQATPSGRP